MHNEYPDRATKTKPYRIVGLILLVIVAVGGILALCDLAKHPSKESAKPFPSQMAVAPATKNSKIKTEEMGWGTMTSLPEQINTNILFRVDCTLPGGKYIHAFISGDFGKPTKKHPSERWRIGDEIYIIAVYDNGGDKPTYFVMHHRPSS